MTNRRDRGLVQIGELADEFMRNLLSGRQSARRCVECNAVFRPDDAFSKVCDWCREVAA